MIMLTYFFIISFKIFACLHNHLHICRFIKFENSKKGGKYLDYDMYFHKH